MKKLLIAAVPLLALAACNGGEANNAADNDAAAVENVAEDVVNAAAGNDAKPAEGNAAATGDKPAEGAAPAEGDGDKPAGNDQ